MTDPRQAGRPHHYVAPLDRVTGVYPGSAITGPATVEPGAPCAACGRPADCAPHLAVAGGGPAS